ncbi:MAG: hypothetical protein AAF086_01195 [Planctomycetota bacterium]
MVTQENDIIRPVPDPVDEFLAQLYLEMGIPTDRLPYTDDFENLVQRYADKFSVDSDRKLKHDVFIRLANLRKAGKLPRLTPAKSDATEHIEF